MSIPLSLLKSDCSSWDYFIGQDVQHQSYSETQSSPITNPDNIYVFLATFHDFNPNGCISIEVLKKIKFMISESFFSNSYSTKNGGSVSVSGAISCIQYRVCSINSRSDAGGSHCSIYATKRNYIIESSFSKSKGGGECADLGNGKQLIDYANISYAEGGACYSHSQYNIQLKSNSIFNNTSNSGCLYHDNGQYFVYLCNIIQNYSVNAIVFIAACKSYEMRLCICTGNIGPYLLLGFVSPYITADQCFFENPEIDNIAEGVLVRQQTESFVNDLSHLSTQDCVAVLVLGKRTFDCRENTSDLYSMPVSIPLSFCIFHAAVY